ncbi:MAG: ATP-dependent helicase HrpB [Gemmatimonadaceae bacterium]
MARAGPPPLPLPIDDVLAPLREALARTSNVVLQAAPGAGKTTRVPLALLDAPWLRGRRMLMLEPRRLATRAAARWMAASLGEAPGETVGFRVRGESRVGRRTRIEVVTEGILTRMLHGDAALDGVGLVIFDEFHERSLHADLGLALTLETQALLRSDLRILVMSATLDGAAVARILGDAPVVKSEGRVFPVEVRHRMRRPDQYFDVAMASAIRHALASDEGSVLAFLPGASEIRRTASQLAAAALPDDVRVLPLFGALPVDAQDAALAPPPPGRRKVVLATSIAETSLTIEGVRIVIDGGLSRVPSFSPRTGMSRLETVRVSRSSAEQRCGRAGRTAPGICYRLWAAEEHLGLLEHGRPEILDADLAPLALDLALAGIIEPTALRWLDAPPAPALAHARELLAQLGAIDVALRITPHGRAMARLATHPRVAHMLLRARELEVAPTACAVAAVLDERDIIRRGPAPGDPDLRLRVALVASTSDARHTADVDRDTLRRAREQYRAWRSTLAVPSSAEVAEADCGAVMALAFPDRIARRREGGDGRYLLRSGQGAVLDAGGALTRAPFLAVAELDGQRPHARILLAAPLDRAELDRLVGDQVESEDVVAWNEAAGAISAVRRERLGAIVLREIPLLDVSDEAIASALLGGIVGEDSLALRWNTEASRVRDRLAFLHALSSEWPDVSERALSASAGQWLLPRLVGMRRKVQVDGVDLAAALLSMLRWEQRSALEELAPSYIEVPSGSRIRIDYSDPSAPALPVRLQELFGLSATPTIADGRVPLTLHLLSPAYRPVQVTRDLAGFWRTSYFEVRRELRGRYPKHEWPEDPVRATPTRRARPRR